MRDPDAVAFFQTPCHRGIWALREDLASHLLCAIAPLVRLQQPQGFLPQRRWGADRNRVISREHNISGGKGVLERRFHGLRRPLPDVGGRGKNPECGRRFWPGSPVLSADGALTIRRRATGPIGTRQSF